MLRLHPILPFLLMFLSFILSHLSYSQSEAAAASSDSAYQRCSQPYKYTCGTNDYSISYPFTVDGQGDGCGHPDYPLKCLGDGDDKNLTINIGDENFNVLNINYTAEVLTIAEQDIEVDQSTCSVKNHDGNTSIDTTRFELVSTDANLTLFNCSTSSPPSPPSSLSSLSCAAKSPGWLWYFAVGPIETELGAWVAGCNKTTLVIKGPPVNEPLNLSSLELLQQALLKGFDIKWKAGNDWCRQCLNSGGTCGYSKNNVEEPTCYCSDGTTGAGSCKEEDKGGMKSLIKISIGLTSNTKKQGVHENVIMLICAYFILYIMY